MPSKFAVTTLAGALSAIILAPMLAGPAGAASFDCEKTDLAADEKVICDTRSLNDADVKMATTFDILTSLLAMGNRDQLREAQSAWLKTRQACGGDMTCLTGAYETRLKQLSEAFADIAQPL
jgi:uncharacterized protein